MPKLSIDVTKANFMRSPFGDKRSSLLRINFKVHNQSNCTYSLENLVVVSDHNKMCYPYALSLDTLKQRSQTVLPNTSLEATLTFDVDSPRYKYWLVLLNRSQNEELQRIPVN